jgi:hypothetical protein
VHHRLDTQPGLFCMGDCNLTKNHSIINMSYDNRNLPKQLTSCVHLASYTIFFMQPPYMISEGLRSSECSSQFTALLQPCLLHACSLSISNTHSFESIENRTCADITYFTENNLRNHHLMLWHAFTVHLLLVRTGIPSLNNLGPHAFHINIVWFYIYFILKLVGSVYFKIRINSSETKGVTEMRKTFWVTQPLLGMQLFHN